MAEYVTKEQVIDWFRPYGHLDKSIAFETLVSDLRGLKAADVEPVKHGRWEKNIRGDYSIVCSECGYGLPTDGFAWMECNRTSDEREFNIWIADVKNYCPNCGAKMDEEVKHER